MTKDEYYLGIALAVAKKSTCLKKYYGAIIVKNDQVLATGYNGSVRGEPHCVSCTKCGHGKDVETYLSCKSVHAEQNALLVPSRQEMLGADLYLACYDMTSGKSVECEAWPCEICLRLTKNAGIQRGINKTGVIYERDSNNILRKV